MSSASLVNHPPPDPDTVMALIYQSDELSAEQRWHEAWQALAEAESMTLSQNDPRLQGEIALQRGIVYLRQDDAIHAVDSLRSALRAFRSLLKVSAEKGVLAQLEVAICNCCLNLVVGYRWLGKTKQALRVAKEAHRVTRRLQQPANEAATLTNLGFVWRDLGRRDKATRCFWLAHKCYHQSNDARGQADSLGNLGIMAFEQGQLQKSHRYQRSALKALQSLDDKAGMARAYTNLGLVHQAIGQPQQAEKHFCKALRLDRLLGCFG